MRLNFEGKYVCRQASNIISVAANYSKQIDSCPNTHDFRLAITTMTFDFTMYLIFPISDIDRQLRHARHRNNAVALFVFSCAKFSHMNPNYNI